MAAAARSHRNTSRRIDVPVLGQPLQPGDHPLTTAIVIAPVVALPVSHQPTDVKPHRCDTPRADDDIPIPGGWWFSDGRFRPDPPVDDAAVPRWLRPFLARP